MTTEIRVLISSQLRLAAGALLLGLVSLPLPAAADTDLPPLAGSSPLGGSEILNVGFSTLFVIAAILVVGWLYTRVKFAGSAANSMINVISSRPLGAKERLMLIEVGEKQLLIGMTSAQVQTLHVFDQPVVASDVAAESTGFAQKLRTAIRGAAK